MANVKLTPSMIAKEGLFQLENNLVLANLSYKEYASEFKGSPKIGDSVQIRKPNKFVASDGKTLVRQDVKERSTLITIDNRKHVAWAFDTKELTLEIEEYSERYIKPAMIVLADAVDRSQALLYKQLFASSGTPGTPPAGFDDFADAGLLMDDMAIPSMGRSMTFNPKGKWGVLKGEKALFNSDQQAQRSIVRRGVIGSMGGFDTYGDQNIVRHQCGSDISTGTPLMNGATADEATTISTDGWSASAVDAVREGDVFTIAGVEAVNPVNGDSTGELMQFVVTADFTATAGGAIAALSYSPPVVSTGAYKNVSALPADNAALTFRGTEDIRYAQNLALHSHTLALCTVPLVMPDSVNWKARVNHNGIGMRILKAYDKDEDDEFIRIDIMWGGKAIYPETGVRHWG